MSAHEGREWVSETPCPRCGCYMTKRFACYCGEVHSDYCINCGRFTSLAPHEHLKLCPDDARCEHGPVMHAHPFEEKAKRMEATQNKIDSDIRQEEQSLGRRLTYDEVRVIVNKIYGDP